MNNFINECKSIINDVHNLLKINQEWETSYSVYADTLSKNLAIIKGKKHKTFNERTCLQLYMNVTKAMSSMEFSLRYQGQDVAKLRVNDKQINKTVTISTTAFDATNKRDFDCDVILKNELWNSDKAMLLRKHFSNNPIRSIKSGKGNHEHRIESMLLDEFSKTKSVNKSMLFIQPIKLAGIARFQMPTPLKASNIKKLSYEKNKGSGGGIDILSRIGRGNTKICVMEVKDQYKLGEPPKIVIKQALAYAAFISELLNSNSGNKWMKIFGFGSKSSKVKIPKDLYVACVMPSSANNDTTFGKLKITVNGFNYHLHYIYFEETGKKIRIKYNSL